MYLPALQSDSKLLLHACVFDGGNGGIKQDQDKKHLLDAAKVVLVQLVVEVGGVLLGFNGVQSQLLTGRGSWLLTQDLFVGGREGRKGGGRAGGREVETEGDM